VNTCGFVFDEIYFPVDAAKDLRQPAESYFDPEPPLTKLLMAPPMAWWGFNTWTWRASTVLFGSLFVGLIYLIARRLRRDRVVAAALILARGLEPLLARIPAMRRIAGARGHEAMLWREAAGFGSVAHYVAAGAVAIAIFSACFSRYLTVEHKDVYLFTACSQGVSGLTGTPETLRVPVTHVNGVPAPDPTTE